VRHRGKIESTLNNARRVREIVRDVGSLAAFVWQFEPTPESRPPRITKRTLTRLTQTPESEALSRDLKRRGFTFVGPTTSYAFMQAMGMVNDHVEGCTSRRPAESARGRFRRPVGAR
jgi:DNA-3-methyladenine glycosylase I